MEALLATGILVSGLYLYSQKNKEAYEDELNKHRVNQYPHKNVEIKMKNYQTVPAFPNSNKSSEHLNVPFQNGKISNNAGYNNLLDMSKRPMKDFMNNNFVPNRFADTQNMNGTGVTTGNFNPDDYNMGGNPATLLERSSFGYAGTDPTYINKKEIGPMFSPSESAEYVYDRPDIRPDLDRYKQDLNNKNMEAPCEKIMTGPGISLDASIPAAGGFNAGLNNRVTPNNVFNYSVNQLPGQVIKGKYYSSELPTALPGIGKDVDGNIYGVPNNKRNKTWINYDERPPIPSGISSVEGHSIRPQVEVKDNNRSIVHGFGTLVPNNYKN